MTVAAVVLAAGGGSRFSGSTHKLLAEVRGAPLVAHAVGAAVASGLPTFVVTGAADLAHVVDRTAVLVPNARWAEGQATSLQAGLAAIAAAGHDVAVVGLGDQPGVLPVAWTLLAGVDAAIAVATYGGRRGNPVRLAASVWPSLPVEGDEGARPLLLRHPDLVVAVACPGDPSDVDTLADLDGWG